MKGLAITARRRYAYSNTSSDQALLSCDQGGRSVTDHFVAMSSKIIPKDDKKNNEKDLDEKNKPEQQKDSDEENNPGEHAAAAPVSNEEAAAAQTSNIGGATQPSNVGRTPFSLLCVTETIAFPVCCDNCAVTPTRPINCLL